MEGRNRAPKYNDTTELPGGGKLGFFWKKCKRQRRCGRPPHDRLLICPVLRADYCIPQRYERAMTKPKRKKVSVETNVQALQIK